MTLKALVVCGDGINCERETAEAFRLAGFQPEIRHLNDLIADKITTDGLSKSYAAVGFPGGFSFGDDLGSGRVLALKIRHGLAWDLASFAKRGGLVIGICNGFQALIRSGVFGMHLSITQNAGGRFQNRWVRLRPQGTASVWLKGIADFELPIRHGEGRLVRRPEATEALPTCLVYERNPNGSEGSSAGLTDVTGRIFGLMPHPEAFVRWTAHPEWTREPARSSEPGHGLRVFENAFAAAREAR